MLTVPALLNVVNISKETASSINCITRIPLGAGVHNCAFLDEKFAFYGAQTTQYLGSTYLDSYQEEEKTAIITNGIDHQKLSASRSPDHDSSSLLFQIHTPPTLHSLTRSRMTHQYAALALFPSSKPQDARNPPCSRSGRPAVLSSVEEFLLKLATCPTELPHAYPRHHSPLSPSFPLGNVEINVELPVSSHAK